MEGDIYQKAAGRAEMEFDRVLYKQKLVGVLSAFDRFCRSNGLTYSVCAGTLLGAVRHKGIIPWDDDIDVMMPRPDYDRFIRMTLSGGMTEGYDVLSAYNCKSYYLPWAKVSDSSTTLIETKWNTDCPVGVFIDVFPVDGVPRDAKQYRRQMRAFNRHRKRGMILSMGNDRSNWRLYLKYRLYRILFNMNAEYLKADSIAARCPFEAGRDVQVFCGGYGDRELLDRSIFNDYVELPFEDTSCMAVRKTEYYLTRFYGDYMQLPPEENRMSHHDHFFVDLSRRWTVDELRQNGII